MHRHNLLMTAWKSWPSAGAPSHRARKTLLGLWIAVLAAGGCSALPRGAPKDSQDSQGMLEAGNPREVIAPDTPGEAGPAIAPAELDELTRAFADRYVGLLSSTCDALKQNNPDPAQRRESQELMLNCATNVYDIASNADAFTRMLDLVVVTTLVSQVWIDDNRAGEVFGDRAEVLVRALHHGRVEAWALAAQVLRPDQLDMLDYLIWEWRRHNPDMVRASFVRFSNFAVGRGRSADAEVVAAGGFLANVGQAGQSIDEVRLLTERMFYLLKRYPTLLRWQMAAMKDDLLAAPGIDQALTDVHRLTDQVEQLPKNVAAERQAILAGLDDRLKGADATFRNFRAALTEMSRTSDALKELIRTADPLFTRIDAWDRRSNSRPGNRAFDVREYTEGVKELAVAVESMNRLMQSSNELLASSEWGRRIEQVSQSADGRMNVASEQSLRVVDAAFWRICLAIIVLFATLILYRLTTLLLARRLRINVQETDGPSRNGGNSRTMQPPSQLVDRGGLSR